MIRFAVRAAIAGTLTVCLLLAVTFGALVAFSALVSERAVPPDAAPLVIVLGGGVREDGVLHPRSRLRVETALRLWREGRAGRLHFTGGGTVAEAEAMRDHALAAGVPADAITVETASETTLQNALFTIRAIGMPPRGTIIVTDAAHLPRAWATFLWAGARGHVVHPGDPWQRESGEVRFQFVLRETLAIWYNAARMAWASVRLALGAAPEAVADSLGRSDAAWGAPP